MIHCVCVCLWFSVLGTMSSVHCLGPSVHGAAHSVAASSVPCPTSGQELHDEVEVDGVLE